MSSQTVNGQSPATAAPTSSRAAVVFLMLLLLAASQVSAGLGQIALLLTLGYVLIERAVRHHAWADLGLRRAGFVSDARSNWVLIVLDVVIVQVAAGLFARFGWQAYRDHVNTRVSDVAGGKFAVFVLLLVVSTFVEELVFRAFFQQRLSTLIHPVAAILAAAVLFGLVHRTSGSAGVVSLDVSLVVLDGMFFGWIYHRSHNLYLTWLTHFAADVVAALVLLT